MTFPDCRNDDYYNEAFLNANDGNFIGGFDWAAEAVDNVFNNIEHFTSESDHIEKFFSEELPKNMCDEYEMELRYPEVETEQREVKTYGDFIRMKILEWLEMARNELITSMIEGMDENMLKVIRNKVLKDNEKLDKPKEFYDTRKYMATGVKKGDGPDESEED